MADEISREVEQFIRDHISSVEELEVLLLLAENPQQQWNAQQVSQKLYRQPESAAMRLRALHAAGLLDKQDEGDASRFRYNTASNATNQTVRALERAYLERKDTVIRLIFSRPPDAVRSFADAFRFRKDD